MSTTSPHSPANPVPVATVISHMVPTFLMGLFMAFAYLAGFHKPEPHHVPLAVVGPQAQAQVVAQKLQTALGDRVSMSVLPTPDAARTALEHLQISGAFIPGADSAQVLVAPAASDTTATIVQKMFQAVFERTHIPLHVTDAVPLTASDPAGQNAFFFLVVLSVSSYAMSIAVGAAGATRPWRDRLLLGVGASLLIAALETALAAYGLGMFGGHVAATFGLALLYSLAVMLIGIGLHPILTRFSTLVFATAFVGLNFTSSGGVFEPMMQPTFFGWLNHFWIGAGFIEAMRRIVYFPHLGAAQPVGLVAGWLVFGVLCVLAGMATERSRRAQPTQREALNEDTHLELEEDVAV